MGFNGGRHQTHSPIAFPAFHSSASLSSSITPSTWFLDSTASNQMKSVKGSFTDSHPYLGKEKITTANGDRLLISGVHTITLFKCLWPAYYPSQCLLCSKIIGQFTFCKTTY
jgi:hypothetical protein